MAKAVTKKTLQPKQVKNIKSTPDSSKRSKESMNLNRYDRIALEAYLLAEQRGFQGGDPVADWLSAEAKVNQEQTIAA